MLAESAEDDLKAQRIILELVEVTHIPIGVDDLAQGLA